MFNIDGIALCCSYFLIFFIYFAFIFYHINIALCDDMLHSIDNPYQLFEHDISAKNPVILVFYIFWLHSVVL